MKKGFKMGIISSSVSIERLFETVLLPFSMVKIC
jgi:hypothetical protein